MVTMRPWLSSNEHLEKNDPDWPEICLVVVACPRAYFWCPVDWCAANGVHFIFFRFWIWVFQFFIVFGALGIFCETEIGKLQNCILALLVKNYILGLQISMHDVRILELPQSLSQLIDKFLSCQLINGPMFIDVSLQITPCTIFKHQIVVSCRLYKVFKLNNIPVFELE